ncbi:type II toxin-antitoxin system RelE/ParE family toxin [Variibacter gotjawalensis]|uniref:type II toxin-antitoxin system RelE/ParE family toxin n=1 Tax=Variibacter gotjawalensis TaxID=1333996 RepID=UPI000BBA4CB6|nr:type II toxin-antitoxin system RelE/ParE family toxin [Variibacter gotjawalensis]
MKLYVLSPRARDDLRAIWKFTAERWSVDQAERYTRQIQQAIETVSADPAAGRSCDLIRAGYRKFPAGSNVIFFRETPDAIDIVRILHARMDFERHL